MMSSPYMTFCLGFLVMCSGIASAVRSEYMTVWVDRDNPSGNGDSETRQDFGKHLDPCPYPNGIECQTTSGESYDKTEQKFEKGYECTLMLGLVCLNSRNRPGCEDYQTRYRCNTGGKSNPCTKNNGLCTHQCYYRIGSTDGGQPRCSCYPGYKLMSDHKTCSEPLRCFECNSINDPTKCGQITKTDDKILQLPCNTMCYTAKDWNGRYYRGCAETNPKYPNRLVFSDSPSGAYNPYRPPSKPGYDSWHHPYTLRSKPDVQYTYCSGDLCNGNGGKAKIIKGYGTLTSQNFGGNLKYDNNIQTTYVIYANHRMKVTFSHFNIEAHRFCVYDSLTLRNGEQYSSPLIGYYCDSKKPPSVIVTPGTTLSVYFKTDGSVQRSGFKMSWTKN
ncbi:unnamed protein product [Owenia fusiformis]|uniref:CUB domain-containing protein n=1 Tax=Owenia fusiformis TaxID=6347 RepID=A0A8S4PNN8_OWEFU|nr:unnamed protein product [Owenia fusiformis]